MARLDKIGSAKGEVSERWKLRVNVALDPERWQPSSRESPETENLQKSRRKSSRGTQRIRSFGRHS